MYYFRIVDLYSQSKNKLNHNDQFVQMHNLIEVRDKVYPVIQKMVDELNIIYWKIAEFHDFSG